MSQIIDFPIDLIHFEPLKRGQLLIYTKDKMLEFILVPKCPLFGSSTVRYTTQNNHISYTITYLVHFIITYEHYELL